MYPAHIKCNERCGTLPTWPSLSEMKHRKNKKNQKPTNNQTKNQKQMEKKKKGKKWKKKSALFLEITQQQSQRSNSRTLTTFPHASGYIHCVELGQTGEEAVTLIRKQNGLRSSGSKIDNLGREEEENLE